MNYLLVVFWVGFFLTVFFSYYFFLRFRNRERTLLIEKGADILEVYKNKENKFPWFILGFSILGIAIGFILVAISNSLVHSNKVFGILFFSLPFFFGAIGLIVGNIIEKRNINNG